MSPVCEQSWALVACDTSPICHDTLEAEYCAALVSSERFLSEL